MLPDISNYGDNTSHSLHKRNCPIFISIKDLRELSFEDICYLLDDLWSLIKNDSENKDHWKKYGYKILCELKNRIDKE